MYLVFAISHSFTLYQGETTSRGCRRQVSLNASEMFAGNFVSMNKVLKRSHQVKERQDLQVVRTSQARWRVPLVAAETACNNRWRGLFSLVVRPGLRSGRDLGQLA